MREDPADSDTDEAEEEAPATISLKTVVDPTTVEKVDPAEVTNPEMGEVVMAERAGLEEVVAVVVTVAGAPVAELRPVTATPAWLQY